MSKQRTCSSRALPCLYTGTPVRYNIYESFRALPHSQKIACQKQHAVACTKNPVLNWHAIVGTGRSLGVKSADMTKYRDDTSKINSCYLHCKNILIFLCQLYRCMAAIFLIIILFYYTLDDNTNCNVRISNYGRSEHQIKYLSTYLSNASAFRC